MGSKVVNIGSRCTSEQDARAVRGPLVCCPPPSQTEMEGHRPQSQEHGGPARFAGEAAGRDGVRSDRLNGGGGEGE